MARPPDAALAGAWVGMRAADWAQVGISGGIHTPYDVFATNLRTRCLPEQLSAGLAYPLERALPTLLDRAEVLAGPSCDNLSLIALR